MIRSHKGTVMLALLVVIFIGGIIAMRLVPSYEIQQRRQAAQDLRLSLTQIRQAMDVKQFLVASWPEQWFADTGLLATEASGVYHLLASLTFEDKLLGGIPRDSTVPSYRWTASSSEGEYWILSNNIASNTNFESDIPPWVSLEANFATETVYFPSAFDDYKFQNKYGTPFSNSNTVIKITK